MAEIILKKQLSPEELVALDQAHLWHPFTQMQTADPPIPIERGEGALLIGYDGTTYIDAVSSWWVNIHGHAHPHIARRVSEQLSTLEHVIFAGFTHRPAVELGAALVGLLPGGMERIFYSDNGSTAVEVGIKMALQFWFNQGVKKNRIVAFEGAYHGDTFGAMSVSSRSKFNEAFFPYLFDVHHIPAPLPGQEEASMAALQKHLESGEVAAMVYEPLVQGAGGMLMMEPAALERLLACCKSSEVLLMADEVMTGFGRTGTRFASEQMHSTPDIMSLSKGLTAGTMALGVTACTGKIYEAFLAKDHTKTFFHGHSFTANPLACTAALASLELYDENCESQIQAIAASHANFVNKLSSNPAVSNLRQRGTICAFDVAVGEETSYFNSIRDRLYNFSLERGVLLRPLGNTVYIMPPYCITTEQLNQVYEVIFEMLESIS